MISPAPAAVKMQRDSYTTTKSMSFSLGEGSANALALSRDDSHVVIAGRNVFKILAIEEDAFVEKSNLRVGKNLNLNYSCNDVVWSALDENLIATGATNGTVVLWNLSRTTRSKQEHVFMDHQRTVNKVLFHPTDGSMLLSGSQDGTVKCFDIRTKEPAKLTFKSNSESVRDLQFVPKSSFSFASVSENGSVQLWDTRKSGERPHLIFTAHSGPVFACDWHPDNPSVLATAGRDRAIKIWNITNVATIEHTIHTVASVGRIKWRPQRKNHIGSTSLVVDASVCVWDIRRPYVPFAAFEKHRDVATGIAWKSSPHIIISASKDCTVWQHVFRDATRPASKAIPQALAVCFRFGQIAQAVTAQQLEASKLPGYNIFKKSAPLDENFHLAQSVLFTFETGTIKDLFSVECAQKYMLNGKTASELCEANAETALQLNYPKAALVWEISKLYCQILTETEEPKQQQQLSSSSSLKVKQQQQQQQQLSIDPTSSSLSTPPNNKDQDHHHNQHQHQHPDENHYTSDTNANAPPPAAAALPAADDNNNSSSETEKQDLLAQIASGLHMNQTLFMPPSTTSYEFNYDVQQDWQVLPTEAFQPRHEIREGSSPPLHLENCSPSDISEEVETVAVENRTSQLKFKKLEAVPEFDFSSHLVKALHYHADKGDVQTPVCVWIALSTVIKLPINLDVLESWCHMYIELLHRHRLHAEAALIIKLVDIMGHLSQQSTTFLVSCGLCGKQLLQRGGNYCRKCEVSAAKCSICDATVNGLMSWCQGCGHGGHISHLRWWFARHNECPAGCGHLCHA